ncbi:twin-arginine translocase subunit TatC [Acidipropionibacterium virtanenii]|uniref:Sec-independent protein translocase protein TatC n=1 Tax=Acidipropionibacterium virtanenii TaxID=2057246 RepID=A0A344UTI0_9ACTN|nr:twin-arginine translocase subunit TatC [Acidipropionibacterium virtanenii]AXE38578.1 Sec-independent protein translocase protein TatC [Acidipropionibacterium virtanenii]
MTVGTGKDIEASEPEATQDHRRLAGFRPPKGGEGGTMSLIDHLKELRYRVVVSLVAVVITSSVAFAFYRPLVEVVMWPYHQASAAILAKNPQAHLQVVNTGVVAPFMLNLRVAMVVGLIAACPIWLYELWAFIVPGLVGKEKRWAVRFLGAAIPLFLAGASLGYWVMPKGISMMLSFTPNGMGITNLLDMNAFLDLELRLILLFGASFLLPVVLVILNMVGVLKAQQLAAARKWSIFGFFCLGAFANPSGDPISMCALAVPLTVMYIVAEFICRSHDRKHPTDSMGIDSDEFKIDVE